MGKIKKKGTSGQAKNYISRTRAVRKLQLSLPDFRRLCIFKGVYPREPRGTKKAFKSATPSTTFYYTKDIQYLLHEPLLQKFRDHKAVSKKIARYLGRGEVGDAARLDKSGVGKIKLDHIIKERYPTFTDAVRDLDDALSMLFLFANLPSNSNISSKTIATCQRLCNEFQHYIIVSHSLRKSFLSIKGIYYQATIQGQDVLWLVPYKFVQQTGGDIDFRIMSTFVEFYIALLGFVNYRLYTNIGLRYPPKFDVKSDELGGELGALKLEGRGINSSNEPSKQLEDTNGTNDAAVVDPQLQKRVDELELSAQQDTEIEEPATTEEAPEEENEIDTFEAAVEGADTLLQPQISNADAGSLFESMTIFLSRETPRQPLEFLLRSFGCKRIGWDAVLGDGAFTNDQLDPHITHQIVDRPPQVHSAPDQAIMENGESQALRTSSHLRVPGRIYVQPQWIWDCVNSGTLLKTELYGPGEVLPPHLSPWVKVKRGEYDPTVPLEAQEKEGEAEEFAQQQALTDGATEADKSGEDTDEDEGEESDELDAEGLEGMDVDSDDEADEDDEKEDDDFAGFDDAENEDGANAEDDNEDLYQKELAAEAAGLPLNGSAETNGKQPLRGILKADKNSEVVKKAQRKRQQDEEELERRKGMMTRKQRKLYERMEHGNKKKEDEAATLRAKRRKIESEQESKSR